MMRSTRIVMALFVFQVCVTQASGQEPLGKPGVKIELRWAEDKPTEGLTESKGIDLSCSDKRAYLHKKVILGNQDIAAARLQKANAMPDDQYFIVVELTREAAKKMARSSGENRDKALVTLLDGKIVAAMVVKARLSDIVPVTGLFTEAEAERIIMGITGK